MTDTINIQDIVNGLPEDRRKAVQAQADVLIKEVQEAEQTLLKIFYEERDLLTAKIKTLRKETEDAERAYRKLITANGKILRKTGNYKTQEEMVYDLVKECEGLTQAEFINKHAYDERLLFVSHKGHITTLLMNLYRRKILIKKDGRYFVDQPYKKMETLGMTELVTLGLKEGSKTAAELVEYVKDKSNMSDISLNSVRSAMTNLLRQELIQSSATYKGQKNAKYTWVGEG